MPVVKKSAAKRETVVRPALVVPEPVSSPFRQVASPAVTVKREAVSFTENVLTVDLTALEALPQGKRQAAVRTARNVLDRASQ